MQEKLYLDNWELEEIVSRNDFVWLSNKDNPEEREVGYITEDDFDSDASIKIRIFAKTNKVSF